jgi:hypothetical protein
MGGRGRHAFLQREAAVTIGAFDESLVAHVEEDPRMAASPTIAIAGDLRGFDFKGFRRIDTHEPLNIPVRRADFSARHERPAIDRTDWRMIPKEAKQSMRFRV